MTDRTPNGLKALREAITDFFTNPQKHIDFSKMEPTEYYCREKEEYINGMRCPVKSVEQVANITKLGSGAYSDVYAIDDSRVLKIVKREDKGYARFVLQCKKYPSNPHFPTILYEGVWGGKTVYILERLSDMPTSGDYRMNDYFRAAVKAGDNPYIGHTSKHIAEIAKVLADESMTGDLHSGNLMFRGETPVITDPCTD